jgi:uncharacterized protein YndB with AHSA1/START domain
MSSSPQDPVIKHVVINAPPEHVFKFFVDAPMLLQWIGTAVEIDARPGGVFRIVPNGVDVIRGTYRVVEPPHRVVFTWGFEGDGQAVPAGTSEVEITLAPVPGGTSVTLVHRALPSSARDDHARGWEHYLSRIAAASTGNPPGPDPLADPGLRHGTAP